MYVYNCSGDKSLSLSRQSYLMFWDLAFSFLLKNTLLTNSNQYLLSMHIVETTESTHNEKPFNLAAESRP